MKQKETNFYSKRPFHSKYRPMTFSSIVGQDHIVSYFKSAILKKQISFAYLFVGKHGIGKTSLSRLISKSLNCTYKKNDCEPCNSCNSCINISLGKSFDVHEINAALNTGVDNIRDVIERIQLSPVGSSYKVCIIDEVHMLSINAFNALLKILEEPPKNVVFILATTDLRKIPSTIVSRSHKISFSPLGKIDLALAITTVLWTEGGNITNKALLSVVTSSGGSFRDALNIIDILMVQERNIQQNNISVFFTEPPYSISSLFLKLLVLGDISKVLQVSHYLEGKKWSECHLINQMRSILQDKIISKAALVPKTQFLMSLWHILTKYSSYDFSQDIFHLLVSDLLFLLMNQSSERRINTLINKKTIPTSMKIDNIYMS